jgi:hypothetical protein
MSAPAQGPSGEEPLGSATRPAPGDDEPEIPLEQVFDVLKNERRRVALAALVEREGAAPIGELAEHVAAYENDRPRAQLSSDERKRAYVGLYQCHLPKMDGLGIVGFDKNRGRVELGPNYPLLHPYIDREVDHRDAERHWARRHVVLGLSAVLALCLVAVTRPEMGLLAPAGTIFVLGLASLGHCRAANTDGGGEGSVGSADLPPCDPE